MGSVLLFSFLFKFLSVFVSILDSTDSFNLGFLSVERFFLLYNLSVAHAFLGKIDVT